MPDFLEGGHAMGERIRAFDWASHPLGPPAGWPQALRMALSLCLSSSFPTAIYWGREGYLLYNDAWAPIPAERHPRVLGLPARDAWSDIWHVVGPQLEQVFATGEGFATYEQMLPMVRDGQVRETWWNYSFTAIRQPDHSVGGIFNQGHEVTDVVFARRERQAELQRWRDRFRQAPAGVALLRGPEHRFEFANDAYLALVRQRDVAGRTVAEALPEAAAQGFTALLDQVYRSGEPHLGREIAYRMPEGDASCELTLDFIYQPTRDAGGQVDGIFVLVQDVSDRARAEAALRISNWQLGEERARLAATVDAEQRARATLRRVSETLEEQVRLRTAELNQALAQQASTADRLRALLQTRLVHQGFLDPDGTVREANAIALEIIDSKLEEVVGQPFWLTPWFSGTPGMPERIRLAVAAAARGETVQQRLELQLPGGRRRFEFTLRPVASAAGTLIGLLPEGIELREPETL